VTRRPIPRQTPARRALVRMMGSVIVVHLAAILIYRLGRVPQRPESVGRIFGVVWTAATVIVVGIGLYRVRAAREASRAERAARRP
jgi:hypothetical protein